MSRPRDIVSDRGPKTLTDIERDYVHAVGLMNSAYMFAVRSFVLAMEAWMKREELTHRQAGERLGIARENVYRLLRGDFPPAHATMLKIREMMTGNAYPSCHKLPSQSHRR